MIENIKNLGTSALLETADGSNREFVNTQDKSVSDKSSIVDSDQAGVKLSEEAIKLEGIKKCILAAPDVDKVKIEDIKAKIAQGKYDINFDKVAKRMVDSFK